jgi:Uncharacterized ABC-type transport system, permease component
MQLVLEMIPIALMLATPLIVAGIGDLYSERAGIVNVGIEGCMSIGGFTAATCLVLFQRMGVGGSSVWLALLLSIITGGLTVSLLGFAAIHMRADQTIAGTAINVLAAGLTVYLSQIIFGAQSTNAFSASMTFSKVNVPILKDIPYIGKILFTGLYPTTYIAIVIVVITWFILYKTPFGLRMRSCGEYPQASASMGIDVVRMRWIGVITSGCLAGLAGAILVLTTQTFYFQGSIHGLGFVAIATTIFGKWNPWGVLGAGCFFGFAQTVGHYSNMIPFLNKMPSEFFNLFPYVITIIALILFSNRSVGPKAAGEIYDSGKR